MQVWKRATGTWRLCFFSNFIHTQSCSWKHDCRYFQHKEFVIATQFRKRDHNQCDGAMVVKTSNTSFCFIQPPATIHSWLCYARFQFFPLQIDAKKLQIARSLSLCVSFNTLVYCEWMAAGEKLVLIVRFAIKWSEMPKNANGPRTKTHLTSEQHYQNWNCVAKQSNPYGMNPVEVAHSRFFIKHAHTHTHSAHTGMSLLWH